MRELGEPVQTPAILLMMERILASREGWDEEPEWGLAYAPPLTMVAHVAQQHGADAAELEGVLAHTVPVPAEAWERAGDPQIVLDYFEKLLTAPKTEADKQIGDRIRGGIVPESVLGGNQPLPPPMAAWFLAEVWLPPQRLRGEFARRRKTGEEQIVLSDLPDRLEARCVWAVDMWGRNYMGQMDRHSGKFSYVEDKGEGDYLHTSQRETRALRGILSALTTPLPN
ncbi:hypothetical protein ACFPC0_11180 [Streptomyces andamanensis]|uniref:Uncharacterized protein n=1 Tax=Streptomyces andamanensis TaxID=1565035 RepID=A0ABV8TCL8_9ACTN